MGRGPFFGPQGGVHKIDFWVFLLVSTHFRVFWGLAVWVRLGWTGVEGMVGWVGIPKTPFFPKSTVCHFFGLGQILVRWTKIWVRVSKFGPFLGSRFGGPERGRVG